MMPATVQINNLRFGFPGNEAFLKVERLAIEAGVPTALVGGNGSGKTTLLRLIHGLAAPQTGSIRLPSPSRTAMIFQQTRLLRLSAQRNLWLAGMLSGNSWTLSRTTAHDWLSRMGLDANANQRATTLSGGQQQRLAIARAMIKQPNVLLADEITASLDGEQTSLAESLLTEFCQPSGHEESPKILIFTSHDPSQVERLAKRVIRLNKGRIESDETLG